MANVSDEKKNQLLNWLYVFALFVAITIIFTPKFFSYLRNSPKEGFSILAFLLILGALSAFFSAYILTPFALRGLKPVKDPDILEIFNEVSEKAGFKKPPSLVFLNTPEINAVAYVSIFGKRVGITEGLIESYRHQLINKSEFKSVLAHELGHHSHIDCFKGCFIFSIVSLYEAVGYISSKMGNFAAKLGEFAAGPGRVNLGTMLFGIIMAVVGFGLRLISKVASILAFHFNRMQEFGADEFGSKVTSRKYMASALEKIEIINQKLTEAELASLPFYDRWQLKPMRSSFLDKLFSTHPSTEARIRRLLSK